MDSQLGLITFPLWEFRRKGIEVSIFAKLATSRPITTETGPLYHQLSGNVDGMVRFGENSMPLHVYSRTILGSANPTIYQRHRQISDNEK